MNNNDPCGSCRLPPDELQQEPQQPLSFRAAETGPCWQYVGTVDSSPEPTPAPRRLNTGRRTVLRRLIRPILRQYDQDRDLNRGFPEAMEALLKIY